MRLHTNILRMKKNGKSPVYVYCYVQGKRVQFHTNVEIEPKYFDIEKEIIKKSCKNESDLNLIINNVKKKITEIEIRYRLMNIELSAERLKREYENDFYNTSFYNFYEKELNEKRFEISSSMYEKYRITLTKMKNYRNSLLMNEFDIDYLRGFENYYKKIGNKQNTINSNLKNIKYFARLAYKKKLISKDIFSEYKIKNVQTIRHYLTHLELMKVIDYYNRSVFSENQKIILSQFLFSCFTGLRFSDIVELKFENIIDDTIVIIPEKTKRINKQIKIPLSAPAKQFIDFNKKGSNIFNTFTSQYTNRELKVIFDILEIRKKITFHSARHTFATLYLSETKDIAGLQKLLGHYSINETMIYAHIIQDDIIKNMQVFESRFI